LVLCCTLILNLYTETASAQGCGQAYFKPQLEARSRVVNGITAQPHSWPWTVWLVYKFPNGMAATCGGSLLGLAQTPGQSDIVVTAAHCVTDMNTGRALDPRGFTVYIGNHDVTQQEVAEVQIGVSKFVWHNNYVPFTNDVAMLRLSAPVKFNNYIQPVCLPNAGQQPTDRSACYASGWGRISNTNDQTARVLQQVRLPILDDNTCAQTWPGQFDPRTMLCAGYLDGSKNVCNGDSGGPLVCQENGRWVLFGSVSFGNKGACAAAYKPGVFARISNYRGWIEQQIGVLRT